MPNIKVLRPGFLTTVQDIGRYGHSHLGISASGAADSVSLRVGNLLLENDPSAAALEMTLVGGEFEFEESTIIAITGSDFKAQLDGKPMLMWASIKINAGQKLSFSSTNSGARCYICIRGGFEVEKILGSTSTHLLTGVGGFHGRGLKKGDILSYPKINVNNFRPHKLQSEAAKEIMTRKILRVTTAPQSFFFAPETIKLFSSSVYQVSEESNRMGLRLIGPSLPRINNDEMVTEGVSLGAIQISHDGKPIILFVEHQTTGGYPKIANVISADIHCIGQLRPRDEVYFSFVSVEEAYKQRLHLEYLISQQSLVAL